MIKKATIFFSLLAVCLTVSAQLRTGAGQTSLYFGLLKGKKAGIVANHTAVIGNRHLVDSLLKSGIQIVKIFSPEHGFRGEADAGQKTSGYTDKQTGLPVVSLYGKRLKPLPEDLAGLDVIIFDIQDVGVRFYTYISTLFNVMEACAQSGIPVIVLDRPNPNGYYIDGPVLQSKYKSFVGIGPLPIVHGMTIGELAKLFNGEKWLAEGVQCKLTVIPCSGYKHDDRYKLPIKPSPNLPVAKSVTLYPSLGLFEGTIVSVGRGTDFPFQVMGNPKLDSTLFSFKPEGRPGAMEPPFKEKVCYGYDLRNDSNDRFSVGFVIKMYKEYPYPDQFFNNFFDKLAGTDQLRLQIIEGKTEPEIRDSWKNDLDAFSAIRAKYLLYPDYTKSQFSNGE